MSLQLNFPPLHPNIRRREPWARRVASYTSSLRPATVRLIDRASSLTPEFHILKRFRLFVDLRARIFPCPGARWIRLGGNDLDLLALNRSDHPALLSSQPDFQTLI